MGCARSTVRNRIASRSATGSFVSWLLATWIGSEFDEQRWGDDAMGLVNHGAAYLYSPAVLPAGAMVRDPIGSAIAWLALLRAIT